MQFSIKSDKISIISERQELSLRSGAWRHWEVTIRYRNINLVTLGEYLPSSGRGRSLPTQTILWWRSRWVSTKLQRQLQLKQHCLYILTSWSIIKPVKNKAKQVLKRCWWLWASRGKRPVLVSTLLSHSVQKCHTHGVRWGLKKAETKVSKLQNSVFCLL